MESTRTRGLRLALAHQWLANASPYRVSEKTMDPDRAKVWYRLLTWRREQLLEELRVLAPDLVAELELTLKELKRHDHNGLDRQG
jgi:hypothetical protein